LKIHCSYKKLSNFEIAKYTVSSCFVKGRQILARKKKKTAKDERVSFKLDPAIRDAISKEIEKHPEWGINSVTEFIRRAIDHELTARKSANDRKIIEIFMKNRRTSREGNQNKDL